jgi:mono/diheme cytochrome c family protein
VRGVVLSAACLSFATVVAPYALAGGGSEDKGRKIYIENCAPCHGEEGRGDGPGARVLPVKPADHTNGIVMSTRSDHDLFEVISKGGLGTGRSSFMPAWQGQLTREQIVSVIAYIRSLAVPAPD